MHKRLALCVAILLAAAAAWGDDFPPPDYKAAPANQLDALLKAKLAWLKKKIETEQKQVDRLRAKARDPEFDGPSHTKAADEIDKVLKVDKQERDDLSEKDALDPFKNTDASRNAKLIQKNVKAWIERLEAMRASELKDSVDEKKSKEEKAQAAKDAKAHGEAGDALKGDLEKAEKESPKLFN